MRQDLSFLYGADGGALCRAVRVQMEFSEDPRVIPTDEGGTDSRVERGWINLWRHGIAGPRIHLENRFGQPCVALDVFPRVQSA